MRIHVHVYGEEIGPEKHELLADVKAVSLYNFIVRRTASGWKVSAIIDV